MNVQAYLVFSQSDCVIFYVFLLCRIIWTPPWSCTTLNFSQWTSLEHLKSLDRSLTNGWKSRHRVRIVPYKIETLTLMNRLFKKNIYCNVHLASNDIYLFSDKIKDLLKPDMVTGMTRLALVNAIYFKGNWLQKFNAQDTTEMPFKINKVWITFTFQFWKWISNIFILEINLITINTKINILYIIFEAMLK